MSFLEPLASGRVSVTCYADLSPTAAFNVRPYFQCMHLIPHNVALVARPTYSTLIRTRGRSFPTVTHVPTREISGYFMGVAKMRRDVPLYTCYELQMVEF